MALMIALANTAVRALTVRAEMRDRTVRNVSIALRCVEKLLRKKQKLDWKHTQHRLLTTNAELSENLRF